MPTVLLLGTIVLLIVASQFPNKPELTNGFICCGLAVVGVIYALVRRKDGAVINEALKAVDYKTLLLLSGLFLVIEGLTQAGVIGAIAETFMKVGGSITPIGASANIAGIGILQKEGYKVPTKEFIRIGIPFTLIAALSGAAVIWFVWAQ